MGKLTAAWCESEALWALKRTETDAAVGDGGAAAVERDRAKALRIAAATLRWYAASKRATNDTSTTWRTSAETASAALAALAATCKEATSGDT